MDLGPELPIPPRVHETQKTISLIVPEDWEGPSQIVFVAFYKTKVARKIFPADLNDLAQKIAAHIFEVKERTEQRMDRLSGLHAGIEEEGVEAQQSPLIEEKVTIDREEWLSLREEGTKKAAITVRIITIEYE